MQPIIQELIMTKKLAFIGSGIATSYTLIPLLDKLSKNPLNSQIEFYIIDKNDDFFKGLPYGQRSGKSVLLIQNLKNFISEPYRAHFKEWMNKRKDVLINEFIDHGGKYAKKWVEDNSRFYEKGDWDELFVPRFFFGKYIEEEVQTRIQDISQKGNAKFHMISKEVSSIDKIRSELSIQFNDGTELSVERAVLSIGSLPFKKLFNGKTHLNSLYINEVYNPSIDENISLINEFVAAQRTKRPIKILVLGANASGLEIIYKICDSLGQNENLSFTSLSSHGLMPDGYYNEEQAKEFQPLNLASLLEKDLVTAKDIADAANKDIDEAEKRGIGAATSVGIISGAFGKLLPRLTPDELLNFACFHGNQIGRRQRCAGQHYLSIIEDLSEDNRFNHLKARFERIESNEEGLHVYYKSDGVIKSQTFDLVINCLGSQNLASKDLGGFLKNLLENEICQPNPSEIGFTIDSKMQASERLHIAGPLLAGNKIEERVFWHLEHCDRIIWSSHKLAERLVAILQ